MQLWLNFTEMGRSPDHRPTVSRDSVIVYLSIFIGVPYKVTLNYQIMNPGPILILNWSMLWVLCLEKYVIFFFWENKWWSNFFFKIEIQMRYNCRGIKWPRLPAEQIDFCEEVKSEKTLNFLLNTSVRLDWSTGIIPQQDRKLESPFPASVNVS